MTILNLKNIDPQDKSAPKNNFSETALALQEIEPVLNDINSFYKKASASNFQHGPKSEYWHSKNRRQVINTILEKKDLTSNPFRREIDKSIGIQKEKIEIEKSVIEFYAEVLNSLAEKGAQSIYFDDINRFLFLKDKLMKEPFFVPEKSTKKFFREAEKNYNIAQIKTDIKKNINHIN